MEQDAATGWLGESSINTIFSASDKHLLIGNEPLPSTYYSTGNYSGGSVIWIDGVESNIDKGGAIFSGAYSISKGKLDVSSYKSLMKGGKSKDFIVAGDPDKSLLIKEIIGKDPPMPKNANPLTTEQIDLIKSWIKEGAKNN